MKTTQVSKLAVITLFGVCAFFSGCSQDQYSIERQYYQATKQAETILANPQATPPSEVQRSIDTFNKLIAEHPKSNLSVVAQFKIAGLYIATEDYEKARFQLDKIIRIYSKFPTICVQAVFLKGSSYESQNNWDAALAQYKKVIADYPLTMKSLETPMYIAQHYKTKFQPDKMVEAYKDAILHYNSMAEKYPLTPLALQSNMLTAQCYAELKDWNRVVSTFNFILEKYKGKARLDEISIDLAVVYMRDFNDKAKAKETLERLINDEPSSKYLPLAKSLLKKISEK